MTTEARTIGVSEACGTELHALELSSKILQETRLNVLPSLLILYYLRTSVFLFVSAYSLICHILDVS